MARQGLRICAEALPADHWLTATGKSILGESLTRRGSFAEAEALLLASYPILRDTRGAEDSRSRRSLERLVLLYEAWGKPEQATRYAALLGE